MPSPRPRQASAKATVRLSSWAPRRRREPLGLHSEHVEEKLRDETAAAVRAELGGERFEELAAEGRELATDDAVAYALDWARAIVASPP